MYNNQITIQPVANGFIVTVPVSNANTQEEGFQFMAIANQFVDKIKGSSKDDLLQKIEKDINEEEKVNNQTNINTFRAPSVYCFHELSEVLSFLAVRYDVSFSK